MPNQPATARDPRVDPHVGDEIARDFSTARAGTIIRTVTRAHGGFVFYKHDNGYTAKPKIIALDDWRRWAKNAEVLNAAH